MIVIDNPIFIAFLHGISMHSPIINDRSPIGQEIKQALNRSVLASEMHDHHYFEVNKSWYQKLNDALDLVHKAYTNIPVHDRLIYMSNDGSKPEDLRSLYFEVMLPQIEKFKKLQQHD